MTKPVKSYRLSDLTTRQIAELSKRWGTTQAETITICVDRAYRSERNRPMTLQDAIVVALERFERWTGGARVVRNDDGSYDAIPGAYLTDASYTGSCDVVWGIEDASELGDGDLQNENLEELAAWIISQGWVQA